MKSILHFITVFLLLFVIFFLTPIFNTDHSRVLAYSQCTKLPPASGIACIGEACGGSASDGSTPNGYTCMAACPAGTCNQYGTPGGTDKGGVCQGLTCSASCSVKNCKQPTTPPVRIPPPPPQLTPVHAQATNDYGSCVETIGKDQVMTIQCIPVLIKFLINAMFGFVGIVTLIMIIVSGITLIRSEGNPEKTESAKNTLTFAIMGLLIVVFAAAIVNFISIVTGASCITVLDRTFGNCK